MITFLWSAEITLFFKKIFQKHFQNFKRFGSRSGSADLGPNCLHSKIIDQDLHCLSDKADFTTNCSTLNESSIFFLFFFYFYYFLLLLLSANYSFSKLTFSKISFKNTVRLSNSLDPDQDQRKGGPNLGPSCLL